MNESLSPENWSWWRLRVRLRNSRNAAAKQHPLFVLRSLIYSARGTMGSDAPAKEDFRFRVSNATGERIRQGAEYAFDLLFRDGDEMKAAGLGTALKTWTADPAHNFECLAVGTPERRDLGALRSERPLDMAAHELCLDFHTPMAFNPPDPCRRWLFEPGQLRTLLERRVQAVFGPLAALPPPANLGLLCHYLHPYQKHAHHKDARVREFLNGMTGPLFLRGEWQAWEPWIRLCSEWLLGAGTSKSQGAFRPSTGRGVIDAQVVRREGFRKAWQEYVEETDHDESFTHVMNDASGLADEMAAAVASGGWQPSPARVFVVPKPSGGARSICLLEPQDALVHRVLNGILSPLLDPLMDEASHGFRAGRSVESARREVLAALREGMDHVVESDIEDFFDSVPWERLEEVIDRVLPSADLLTRELLARVIRTPLAKPDSGGRLRGLLQGSPLSPLLANLFLIPFDLALRESGLRLVRYADDFVILTRGEAAAETALETVRAQASALGLTLKEDKTAIRNTSLGFRFLGHDLGGDFEDAVVERTALRRSVVFRPPYGFVGIDHHAVVLKRDRHLVAHIPLERIGHLVFHGSFGISTVLMSVCATRGIPVTLCSAAGHHRHTFAPLSRDFHQRLGRHEAARRSLEPKAVIAVAASAVVAKLEHHACWLGGLPEPGARLASAEIRKVIQRLPAAESVEALRGMEGHAAKAAFHAVNGLVHVDEFRSSLRLPHDKPDRWNALLDFGYSQLYSHLNALVRGEGLNPFLGFLHSPDDRFESLVADLEEPFRARVDRWAVRAVNLGTVKPEDFAPSDDGSRWGICSEAYPKLIESFACELDRKIRPDPGTLHQLLHAQVLIVRAWVDQDDPLRFWVPPREID